MAFLSSLAMCQTDKDYVVRIKNYGDSYPTDIVLLQLAGGEEPVRQACISLLTSVVKLGVSELETLEKILSGLHQSLLKETSEAIKPSLLNSLSFIVSKSEKADSVLKLLSNSAISIRNRAFTASQSATALKHVYAELCDKIKTCDEMSESNGTENVEKPQKLSVDVIEGLEVACTASNNLESPEFRGFSPAKQIIDFLWKTDSEVQSAYFQFLHAIVYSSPEESSSEFLNHMSFQILNKFKNEKTTVTDIDFSVLLSVFGACPNLTVINHKTEMISYLLEYVVKSGENIKKSIMAGKILGVIVNKSEQQDKLNKIINYCRTISQTHMIIQDKNTGEKCIHLGIFSFLTWTIRGLVLSGGQAAKQLFNILFSTAVKSKLVVLANSCKIILKCDSDVGNGEQVDILTKRTHSKIVPYWRQYFISIIVPLLENSKSPGTVELTFSAETIGGFDVQDIGIKNAKG